LLLTEKIVVGVWLHVSKTVRDELRSRVKQMLNMCWFGVCIGPCVGC